MMAKHNCMLNKLFCFHMNRSTFTGLISVRPPIGKRKNYQYWLIYYSQTQQTFSNTSIIKNATCFGTSSDTKIHDLNCACILVPDDGPEVAKYIVFIGFIIKNLLCLKELHTPIIICHSTTG